MASVSSPRSRLSSLATVVGVLSLAVLLESTIAVSLSYGAMRDGAPVPLPNLWLALRVATVLAVILFWWRGAKRCMFRAIVVADILLTAGLAAGCARLIYTLVGRSDVDAPALLLDIVLLAMVNVLAYSIWYWIIDPPGIDQTQPSSAPIEFLFPQRASVVPGYEIWHPRYTDYLYLAFATSVAFVLRMPCPSPVVPRVS